MSAGARVVRDAVRATAVLTLVLLLVPIPARAQESELAAARLRYREMVSRAAELALPSWRRAPAPGERHSSLAILRARLAAEGYGLEAPDDPAAPELFDGALRTGIGHFQYGHGLESTGRLDASTERALRVPLTTRLEQVEGALAALRTSAASGLSEVLRVNVPGFEARLILGGETVERFRVIVGRARASVHPISGQRGHWDRTPLLSGHIDRIVFHPVWRVPERIRRGDLLPRETREPGYLAAHGFLRRGESVVQLPGPGNALGRVKFLFDNDQDVYLHDTPQRHLFGRSRRDLSHGCVRVEGAERLARRLFARESPERGLDAEALWAEGREVEIALAAGLPVFIEYVLVTVGPHGYLRFHPDVYDLSP